MAELNLYRVLRGITRRGATLVGEISAHNADGTSLVNFLDGTSMLATGTGVAVGQRAFVQDGQVMDQAPTLPFLGDIEI